MKSKTNKSCTTQHLKEETPSANWGVERLGKRAVALHASIVRGEKELSVSYWRLGQALLLAKESLPHGEWLPYLAKLKIEKTRASRAVAIFKRFPQGEKDVAQFTVQKAYAARDRVPSTPRKTPANSESTPDETAPHVGEETSVSSNLQAYLSDIVNRIPDYFSAAESMTPTEAEALLSKLDLVLEQFSQLRTLVARKTPISLEQVDR